MVYYVEVLAEYDIPVVEKLKSQDEELKRIFHESEIRKELDYEK